MMSKEIFFERLIGFIAVMMVLNVIIWLEIIQMSFEIKIIMLLLFILPLIGMFIWLWWFEKYE